ncbi:MAG TPA: TolC family protein [Pirellulales bacterium]|jgi:cobalt-zinc-cadmium efflux system outer membrane protein|nr:TolC family protein [Pirellulales bacterium]
MSRLSGIIATLLLLLIAPAPGAWGQEVVPLPGRVLTLDEATRLALSNSPLLQRAEARVEQARGRVIQAGLYPNPRYDGGNPHQLGGTQSLYNTGITQPVVSAGKLQLDVGINQRALTQAELRLQQQHFELLTEVRRQFFELLATQDRYETIENIRSIGQQSLNISEQLFAGEQGTETDVLLLRIQLRRIEVNAANLGTMVEAKRRTLAATIGLPDMLIGRVSGDLTMPLPDFDDADAQARLLRMNSALLAARTEIARNQIRLRRAQVEWIPNVEWQGGYQYTVAPTRNQAVIAAYFDVPLWNRNQGNIMAVSANLRGSEAQSWAVANDLLRQLAGALGHYRASRRMVINLERSVLPDARRSAELVLNGYRGGEFELVKLLNAQRTLFETNLDYISAQQERLTAGADVAGLLQLEQFP